MSSAIKKNSLLNGLKINDELLFILGNVKCFRLTSTCGIAEANDSAISGWDQIIS